MRNTCSATCTGVSVETPQGEHRRTALSQCCHAPERFDARAHQRFVRALAQRPAGFEGHGGGVIPCKHGRVYQVEA